MKIQIVTLKWINLLLVLLVLLGYQYVWARRDAAEKVAELENRVEILSAEKDDAEAAIRTIAEQRMEKSGEIQDEQADRADSAQGYPDGVWQGTAPGFGGDITVEVSVENGTMTDIRVISSEFEDQEYMDMAEKMIPEMLEAQDTDVDLVTGATLSSSGLRDAAAAALKAGE